MKAVIYSRVSSNAQADEGYSLEAQHNESMKYIESEKMELIKVYTDPGVSAKTLNRPGVQEMIADLKAGKFQAIIIHKLDRLTRNISDLYDLVEMVIKHDVKLISLSEKIDTSTPMGRMFIYMLGILAQMFRENLSQEITKGQSVRASKGLRLSPSRPYGYDLGPNLAMTVNDQEAHTIRQIFDWFNEGYNILTIINKLDGVGKMWYPITIRRILVNATYLGVAQWKSKSAAEGHYIEGAHEAIISEESYRAAQEIMGKRKDKYLTQSMGDFCFSTVVKCGLCGRSFVGRTRNEKQRNGKMWKGKAYRCVGHIKENCKVGSISETKITELFLNFISDFSFNFVEPQKILAGRDIVKDKKKFEKLISESENARMNYSRAMGSGKMDFEMFSKLIDEENKKVETWKSELDNINLNTVSGKKTRKDVLSLLDRLKKDWNGMDELQKKMHISKLFKFIVINRVNREWIVMGYKLSD